VTATPTFTPSPGITPGGFGQHPYQCYEVDRTTLDEITDLPVEDRFGATAIDIGGNGRVKRICNPANVNGQHPAAAIDPSHIMGYVITKRTPRVNSFPKQSVSDQFGSLTVSLTKPILLMVPSAKSLVAPPAPIDPPAIDHYQCYGVTNATRRVTALNVVDQFTNQTVDIKRPSRLCVAVDKRGEGVLDPAAALMCYGVRTSKGFDPYRGPVGPMYVDNQFGPDVLAVARPTELCVPATVTEAPAKQRRTRR
jgi:hypothetical protein